MTNETEDAVRKLVAELRQTPGWRTADEVTAAAALKLAQAVDGADAGRSAAEASRELRLLLERLEQTAQDNAFDAFVNSLPSHQDDD